MKNIYLLGALLTMATLFGSCKKDDNPSNTEKLTSKKWVQSAHTVSPAQPFIINGATVQITDIYAQGEPCDNDDQFLFGSDKVFTWDEGASKCNSASPQVFTAGTWSWVSDEKILRIAFTSGGLNGNTREYNMQELSTSTLKATFTETVGGIKYTHSQTFTGQ